MSTQVEAARNAIMQAVRGVYVIGRRRTGNARQAGPHGTLL